MAVGRRKLTYEDYVLLPEPPDARRYEILDGEIYVSPSPVPRHQEVSLNLLRMLDAHIRRRHLGKLYYAALDVLLHEHTIAQPDIIFVAAGREQIITERAIEGPPDLVVEILSPSTARRDRGLKARLYARFGIPHYWIVDPRTETLTMYEAIGVRYGEGRTFIKAAIATNPLFPGLRIGIATIWPAPLRR
jgi:Uma2 family endonuclease